MTTTVFIMGIAVILVTTAIGATCEYMGKRHLELYGYAALISVIVITSLIGAACSYLSQPEKKVSTILPIPEGYRPYTKAEISEHLLRPMRPLEGDGLAVVIGIFTDEELEFHRRYSGQPIFDLSCFVNLSGMRTNTEGLVRNYVWRDTGEPCGVKVKQ